MADCMFVAEKPEVGSVNERDFVNVLGQQSIDCGMIHVSAGVFVVTVELAVVVGVGQLEAGEYARAAVRQIFVLAYSWHPGPASFRLHVDALLWRRSE